MHGTGPRQGIWGTFQHRKDVRTFYGILSVWELDLTADSMLRQTIHLHILM